MLTIFQEVLVLKMQHLNFTQNKKTNNLKKQNNNTTHKIPQ